MFYFAFYFNEKVRIVPLNKKTFSLNWLVAKVLQAVYINHALHYYQLELKRVTFIYLNLKSPKNDEEETPVIFHNFMSEMRVIPLSRLQHDLRTDIIFFLKEVQFLTVFC